MRDFDGGSQTGESGEQMPKWRRANADSCVAMVDVILDFAR
jgi:hypothetical protein